MNRWSRDVGNRKHHLLPEWEGWLRHLLSLTILITLLANICIHFCQDWHEIKLPRKNKTQGEIMYSIFVKKHSSSFKKKKKFLLYLIFWFTNLGTIWTRFWHKDWINQVPLVLSLKETWKGTVAIPSRKSALFGIPCLAFIASVQWKLYAELSDSMKTACCSLFPWQAWMKNSLGLPTKDGQFNPLKRSVKSLILTVDPSTPYTLPSTPWLRTQHTTQSNRLWSLLPSSLNTESIWFVSQSWWLSTLKPSHWNTLCRHSGRNRRSKDDAGPQTWSVYWLPKFAYFDPLQFLPVSLVGWTYWSYRC